jgi:hypothetical protein
MEFIIFKLKNSPVRHLCYKKTSDIAKEKANHFLQQNFPLDKNELKKHQAIVNYTKTNYT